MSKISKKEQALYQRIADKLVDAGDNYLQSLRDQVDSSLKSQQWLTLKIFDSKEEILNSWDERLPNGKVLKLSLEYDEQWASSFSSQVRQLMLLQQRNGKQIVNFQHDDVLFVQNLKGSDGKRAESKRVVEVARAMGYRPVTPGFFIKVTSAEGHLKPLASWFRNIFGSVKNLRSYGRGATTTPFLGQLSMAKDDTATRFFVMDLDKAGQVGADGGNEFSWTLQHSSIVTPVCQGRVHAPWYEEHKQALGFQVKGQFHMVRAWIWVHDDGSYERVTTDILEDRGHLDHSTVTDLIHQGRMISAFIIHYDNVKGSLSEEVEKQVSKLDAGFAIDLADWWYTKYGIDVKHKALVGGIISNDNERASSSVAWQDTVLRSPSAMKAAEKGYRAQLKRKLNKVYLTNNQILKSMFSEDQARYSASALGGINQRKINHIVFGAGLTVPTKYCEQLDMPNGYVIGKAPKTEQLKLSENDLQVVALTGQPQLYHHCLITAKVISYPQICSIFNKCRRLAKEAEFYKEFSCDSTIEFVDAFREHLESKGMKFTNHQEFYSELVRRLRPVVASSVCQDLIWMSKDNQDRLQRDSDGDRILIFGEKWYVEAIEQHMHQIRNQPMPHIEVDKATKVAGDPKVFNASPFSKEYGDRIDRFICAENQGQGPTGLLVNLCSALLAHLDWSDDDYGWNMCESQRDWGSKFYANLLLITQCSIDNTKKMRVPPSCLYFMDLSDAVYERAILGGTDYKLAGIKEEAIPSMKVGEKSKDIYVKISNDEMYNVPALKTWVCWAINFIKAGYDFHSGEQWYRDMRRISEVFASTEEDQEIDWDAVKQVLGDDLDPSRWLFPERAYAWKNEASLDVSLWDAPPALNILSQWAVDVNKEIKNNNGIISTPDRAVYDYWHENKRPQDATADYSTWECIAYTKALFKEYMAQKRDDIKEMSQSEFYQAKGASDANEFLDNLLLGHKQIDLPSSNGVFQLAQAAFSNTSEIDNKVTGTKGLAYVFYKAWIASYEEYLMKVDPLKYMAVKCVKDDKYLDALLENENPDSVCWSLLNSLSGTTGSDTAKMIREELVSVLVEAWHNKDAILPDVVLSIRNVGQKKLAKLKQEIIRIKADPEETLWTETIWSDFIPALDVHLQNIAKKQVTHNYFAEQGKAEELIDKICRGEDIKEGIINPMIKDFIESKVRSQSAEVMMAINSDLNVKGAHGIVIHSQDNMKFLIGLMVQKGLMYRVSKVLQICAPLLQASKLYALALKSGYDFDEGQMHDFISDKLFNTRLVWDEGLSQLREIKELKGRVSYPVKDEVIVDFASGLLENNQSFYLLQETYSIWLSKNGKINGGRKLTPTKRWVLHSSLQYKLDGQDPRQTISLELFAKMGIGHCFSKQQLTLLGNMAKAKLKANPGNYQAKAIEKLTSDKLALANNYVELSFDVKPELKHQLVDKVCFPYFYGGKSKIFGPHYRSSTYRVIWRYLMAISNDKNAKFELYKVLSGACFGAPTITNEDTMEDVANVLASVQWGNDAHEQNPKYNHVGLAFISGNALKYDKLQKSWPERVHHVVVGNNELALPFIHGKHCMLGSDSIEQLVEQTENRFTKEVDLIRSSVKGKLDKLNGVNSPAKVVEVITAMLRDSLVVQTHKRAFAELVLGCLHTTSLVDSYAMKPENLDKTKLRFMGKTPSVIKAFMRANEEFSVTVPDQQVILKMFTLAQGDK